MKFKPDSRGAVFAKLNHECKKYDKVLIKGSTTKYVRIFKDASNRMGKTLDDCIKLIFPFTMQRQVHIIFRGKALGMLAIGDETYVKRLSVKCALGIISEL